MFRLDWNTDASHFTRLWVATSGKANEGFWYVRRMSLSFKNGTQAEETAEVMAGLTDPTPLGLSYSCNEAPPFISKTTVKGTTSNSLTLYFKGLQVGVVDSYKLFFVL